MDTRPPLVGPNGRRWVRSLLTLLFTFVLEVGFLYAWPRAWPDSAADGVLFLVWLILGIFAIVTLPIRRWLRVVFAALYLPMAFLAFLNIGFTLVCALRGDCL